MDPIVKPFILRSNRKTLLAKPFLLVAQPLSLHLIHPQNLGKEAGQMYVEKEEDVDSFYTRRRKKKRGIFTLHDGEVFEEKREKIRKER